MQYHSAFPRKTFHFLCCILFFNYDSLQTALAEQAEKRAITAEDLLAIHDIKAMAMSPDGNNVAYQVVQADKDQNDYNISWYVAATKTTAVPLMVANDGETHLRKSSAGHAVGDLQPSKIVWAPDSEWVYFTKKKNGALQIWRSHRSRYGHEQISKNAADVKSLKFSADGSTLFFAVGRTRSDIKAIYKKQARRGHLMQYPGTYSVERGPVLPLCSDGQERWVPYTIEKWTCNQTVWAIDRQTGIEREATLDETKAYFTKPDLNANLERLKGQTRIMETPSPDGSRLAWFENIDPSLYKGYRPPMIVAASDGNKTVRCLAEVCRGVWPEKLWWYANGNEVIFLMRDGPRNTLTSLYGWTPGAVDMRTILSGDEVLDTCDFTGGLLICGYETWTSPKKIVSVDLKNGEIRTLADMNPAFQKINFTKIEKIIGEDDYGSKAHAHLVYPSGYQKGTTYPLVIVQYRSRGFLRGGVGDEQPIHVYAQQGFAVLSFDMPSLENDDAKIDNILVLNKHLYRREIIDNGPLTAIDRMVRELTKRGIIDPNRIAISGMSAGAATTISALLTRNYAAASVAAFQGAPPNFRFPPLSLMRKIRNSAFGGTPFSKTGFKMRAKYSLAMNAHRIDTPLLIQAPDSEYRRQSHHALEEAGKPVEVYVYPDEHHVQWQPAHRYMIYNRNIDWFNFWLLGVEDNISEKAGQYARWNSLRVMHQGNLKTLLSER